MCIMSTCAKASDLQSLHDSTVAALRNLQTAVASMNVCHGARATAQHTHAATHTHAPTHTHLGTVASHTPDPQEPDPCPLQSVCMTPCEFDDTDPETLEVEEILVAPDTLAPHLVAALQIMKDKKLKFKSEYQCKPIPNPEPAPGYPWQKWWYESKWSVPGGVPINEHRSDPVEIVRTYKPQCCVIPNPDPHHGPLDPCACSDTLSVADWLITMRGPSSHNPLNWANAVMRGYAVNAGSSAVLNTPHRGDVPQHWAGCQDWPATHNCSDFDLFKLKPSEERACCPPGCRKQWEQCGGTLPSGQPYEGSNKCCQPGTLSRAVCKKETGSENSFCVLESNKPKWAAV